MNAVLLTAIFVSIVALNGCGTEPNAALDDVSETKNTSYIHKIQPLGVNSSCFGSNFRTIRDHRVTPTRVYQQYFLQMKDCSPPASSLVVQMLGGGQWVGGWSYVTIKKNGLCLTNVNGGGNYDDGESRWETCVAQNGTSPERYRQQWLLNFNNNNALRIESHAAVRLGFPNAQVQCLDRRDPVKVSRGACNLHNWQIIRAN